MIVHSSRFRLPYHGRLRSRKLWMDIGLGSLRHETIHFSDTHGHFFHYFTELSWDSILRHPKDRLP